MKISKDLQSIFLIFQTIGNFWNSTLLNIIEHYKFEYFPQPRWDLQVLEKIEQIL